MSKLDENHKLRISAKFGKFGNSQRFALYKNCITNKKLWNSTLIGPFQFSVSQKPQGIIGVLSTFN